MRNLIEAGAPSAIATILMHEMTMKVDVEGRTSGFDLRDLWILNYLSQPLMGLQFTYSNLLIPKTPFALLFLGFPEIKSL